MSSLVLKWYLLIQNFCSSQERKEILISFSTLCSMMQFQPTIEDLEIIGLYAA
jgi:hypothetical protein